MEIGTIAVPPLPSFQCCGLTAAVESSDAEASRSQNRCPVEFAENNEVDADVAHGAGDAVAEGDIEELDTASMGSAGKASGRFVLTINSKKGGPQQIVIEEGGAVPCMVCGRCYTEMPPNCAFCWPHKRAVDNLIKKWRPLPKSQQAVGYINPHQEKLDLFRKYSKQKMLPPSPFSKLVYKWIDQYNEHGPKMEFDIVGFQQEQSATTRV